MAALPPDHNFDENTSETPYVIIVNPGEESIMDSIFDEISDTEDAPLTEDEMTPPSIDPYFNPTPLLALTAEEYQHYYTPPTWTHLPQILDEWRVDMEFPTIMEFGESSTTIPYPLTHEPPHHTTPLLTARISQHEARMDYMDNLIDDIHDHLTTLKKGMKELRETTEWLKTRIIDAEKINLSKQINFMEEQINTFGHRADLLETYHRITREQEAMIAKGKYREDKQTFGNNN